MSQLHYTAVRNAPKLRVDWSRFKLPAFTSLGGYTIGYYDLRTCDTFCAECASFERFKTQLTPSVYWEGPTDYCASCHDAIEPTYT